MTFPEAVKSAFKNYAKFDGRASRSEYWWFWLFEILVLFAFAALAAIFNDNILGGIAGTIYVVAALGMIVPSLALLFRRLHDTDRRAWWIFISFIPLVGSIVLFVFTVLDGTLGPNKYGPRPGTKGVAETFS